MSVPRHTVRSILRELRAMADPRVRAQMAHFGVHVENAFGISAPKLHRLAGSIGKDHALAQQLQATSNHEARILAALIDDPAKVTEAQMERWARDFDAWDVVDGTCCYLFAFAAPAWKKAIEWSRRREEFVKRAGFVLMAYFAYKDKAAPDSRFHRLLAIVRREANDERHFVKKGVNWALRNIGKRNRALNRAAIRTGLEIRALDSPAARWIASDALRELRSRAVQERLRRKTR
ncbi:MAG: DNA alkylation repair protein [Candidatus Acidiferrales bacterium]|jgi:3-methyladenine DNA glycosylase AlkD